MNKEKILIVDDDKDIINLLTDILNDEGYIVEKAYNGTGALQCVRNNHYDLIILDIMLPDMDGLEICKKVRDEVEAPILFLTAKNKNIDKIVGYEIGADDYVTKPFDDNVLLANIKAHLRRQKRIKELPGNNRAVIKFKGIEINKNSFEVIIQDNKIELSTREFQILKYLMENPNRVLTREEIYDSVWGYEEFGDINTVTVHIKKLREKVDKNDRYIKTVWGVGYKFIGEEV